MSLELGELRVAREVPDDDGVDTAGCEPVAAERCQAPDHVRVPLELDELRAGRDVPDDDRVVITARRESVAIERGQASDPVRVPLELVPAAMRFQHQTRDRPARRVAILVMWESRPLSSAWYP